MSGFLVAVSFLTRVPVPGAAGFNGDDVGKAQVWFPAVGALIGLVSVGLPMVLDVLIPGHAPPMVLAVLSAVVYARLTGALHLDAVADVADGFGGGQSRDQVLKIMRDSVIGAYGATALILVLFLRIAALTALFSSHGAVYWAIAAGALSRAGSVVLGSMLPYAGGSGKNLGAASTEHGDPNTRLYVVAVACGITIALTWIGGLFAIAAVAAWIWHCHRLYRARLGGVTGDGLGAATEGAEVIALAMGAMLFH